MNISSPNASLFDTQQIYTDLNQLNAIRQQGQEDQSAALKSVAKQFESMFTQMILKSMRSANEVFGQDNFINSPEMKFRQQMFDDQLGVSLSQGRGIGLADVLYRQLSQQYLSSDNAPTNDQGFRTVTANPYPETHKIPQRIQDARDLNALENPNDFIQLMTPYAKKTANNLNTDYRYLLAQAALETGWGQHAIRDKQGNHSFNLFNIKADTRWQGRAVTVPTLEYVDGVAKKETAAFRRYPSIEDSFADFEQFLQQSRYQTALDNAEKPDMFINELHKAGYATDPNYVQKIQSIVDQYFKSDATETKNKELLVSHLQVTP